MIFTLQETRRISAQLTVHYKRGLYVLEDAVDNRRLRRTVALVSEAVDGTVTIRAANDRVLSYRLFHTNQAQLVPGVVVARLGCEFRKNLGVPGVADQDAALCPVRGKHRRSDGEWGMLDSVRCIWRTGVG